MSFKKLFLAGLLASASHVAYAQSYSNVISFGDSLSDNGNVFAATAGAIPPFPYFNGRYSNGLVWTEILAATFRPQTGVNGSMNGFYPLVAVTPGANTNFAFGGARADNTVTAVPNVRNQIDAFGARAGTFGANSLVTIWAGANDIFQSVNSPATAVTVIANSAAVIGG